MAVMNAGILAIALLVFLDAGAGEQANYCGKQTYTTQTPDYTTPNTDYTTPNTDYTTPNTDYTTPNTDYTTPKTDYTTPNTDYTTPNTDYTTPNTDYTTPNTDYTTPNTDYTTPKTDYTTPKTDYTTQTQGYTTQTQDYTTQPPDYTTQTPSHTTPTPDRCLPDKFYETVTKESKDGTIVPAKEWMNLTTYAICVTSSNFKEVTECPGPVNYTMFSKLTRATLQKIRADYTCKCNSNLIKASIGQIFNDEKFVRETVGGIEFNNILLKSKDNCFILVRRNCKDLTYRLAIIGKGKCNPDCNYGCLETAQRILKWLDPKLSIVITPSDSSCSNNQY